LQIGLKLWSTNRNYISPALKLYKKGYFDYIELFVVLGSVDEIRMWQPVGVPFVLHAPHSRAGLNFSQRTQFAKNIEAVSEVKAYHDALQPSRVIFHPGISGSVDETVLQIQEAKKLFPEIFNIGAIENKPKIGLDDEKCLGYSCEEIGLLKEQTGLQFCLDFGHAICSAVAEQKSWKKWIMSFLKLNPVIFHLSDGHIDSHRDEHLHLGEGTYDLSWILSRLANTDSVSLETKKNSPHNLDDFQKDVEFLRLV
jgi:deoxyribonuclease IV